MNASFKPIVKIRSGDKHGLRHHFRSSSVMRQTIGYLEGLAALDDERFTYPSFGTIVANCWRCESRGTTYKDRQVRNCIRALERWRLLQPGVRNGRAGWFVAEHSAPIGQARCELRPRGESVTIETTKASSNLPVENSNLPVKLSSNLPVKGVKSAGQAVEICRYDSDLKTEESVSCNDEFSLFAASSSIELLKSTPEPSLSDVLFSLVSRGYRIESIELPNAATKNAAASGDAGLNPRREKLENLENLSPRENQNHIPGRNGRLTVADLPALEAKLRGMGWRVKRAGDELVCT